ncbi:transmembrane protein 132D isoform X2 [Betta splendens]|uniref:Transmembrane protein 132D isoform X2 n=1 Tax=Betta splendens TaxID=158456 RepID=A0A6P7LX53_BETSP|nr:transmembrane protein 132D isoform X2 [Betta splendens]
MLLLISLFIAVSPAAWTFLPVSQTELGPLFSNSSPFSFSQSLLVLPPPGSGPRPSVQASFGPYSATQLVPEPVVPLGPSPSASLLSEHIERERDEGGRVRFRVRVLFHQQGGARSQEMCVTLHAFKDTEEHKAFCTAHPPLGLCVATLTLPDDWFEDKHSNRSHHNWDKRHSNIQLRERHRGRRHRPVTRTPPLLRSYAGVDVDTQAVTSPRGPLRNLIQLYYSFSDADAELQPTGAAQSQRQLVHIRAMTLHQKEVEAEVEREQSWTEEEEMCLNGQEEEELSLDSHVMIRYHRGPVIIGTPIKVSVNLRANVSAESVVIRLKVKKGLVSMVAQRSLTSDPWAVALERSQGARHDVLSILCHKHSVLQQTHNPALSQQVVCLSVDGLRRSFGVAMTVTASWWVEYSGHGSPSSPQEAAVSSFSFTDRYISGITPITESKTIINTALLNSQPVSLPVMVLAIGHDGKVSDVTSAVTCYSTNEDTVKVSGNCSSLFVDGSESGLGSTCAMVDFLLGTLSGSLCLQVWVPSVPLRVSLVDPVLNAIEGWNQFTESGCVPVYQRSSVQVLTQFVAQDSQSRTTHLLSSSDWFVDVTELVRDWLRVEDPWVASLSPQNNLIGLRPGRTSLHVISEQWDGILGRCDITVTSDPVTPGDLFVQVVSGLGMSVTGSPAHPSIITTTVTAYNTLYNQHQEASISIWLQFSDDTSSLLSFFSDLSFFLRLSSLAETVVEVVPGSSQRIFAQGDGGGPLLRAELLVSTCTDKLITIDSKSEGDWDWMDTRGGGGTRWLAKGSGWIRVNLDLDPEDGEVFDFDVSDTLVESHSDIYTSHFDKGNSDNGSNDYYDQTRARSLHRMNGVGNGEMLRRNNLERAVLMPSQEEGAVYFSPSQEKEAERQEEREQEARELELGMGAVLALLCLCAVLFLANCLPCALKDRLRLMTEEDGEAELDGEEGGRRSGEGEDRSQQQQCDRKEIIC